MFKTFEFCIPTTGTKVPAGPDWLHEVKYDGYRLRLERDGERVRLITRGGYNWTDRHPWIVEAARKVRQMQFVLDGEAVNRIGRRTINCMPGWEAKNRKHSAMERVMEVFG